MLTVLVVTPSSPFGAFVQEILEEEGLFQVVVETRPVLLPEILARYRPQVVILDGDLEEIPLPDLVAGVRAQWPEARVIVLPPEGMPPEAVEALQADGVLDKPFFAPDFVALLRRWEEEQREAPEALPEWLKDVQKAAGYLTQLTLETAALASALVTRDARLLAYAGQLPRLAAEELAQMVAYYWEGGGRADFARYLTLESVQGEFMLYVTSVTRDVALAVLFDAELPFSQIRSQASHLARALTESPPVEAPPKVEKAAPAVQESPAEEDEAQEEEAEPLPPEAFRPLFDDVPPPLPEDWRPTEALTQEQQEVLDALLRAVENGEAVTSSTTPPFTVPPEAVFEGASSIVGEGEGAGGAQNPEGQEAEETGALATSTEAVLEGEASPATPADEAPGAGAVPEALTEAKQEETPPPPRPEEAPTAPVETALAPEISEAPTLAVALETDGASTGEAEASEAPTLAVEVNAKPSTPRFTPREAGELPPPATFARADLYYACVLLPRLPHHHITGDLARALGKWVQRICTAFGWRLTHLAVRPNYLHWVVQVLPNTSPDYAVRVVREHTSNRIFAHFPHLAHDNPSGDFWAPGYLVMGQPQPLPVSTIVAFIRETRRRQGVDDA